MNTILKYAAYGLGAVALLIGSFVTFSVVTGTPMNEMKAVGGLFPENVTAEIGEETTLLPETEDELSSDQRSPRQVYDGAATSLGAFALQDPFSAEELRDLEKRLQLKLDEVARRASELDQRERQIEEDRQHVADLYADLQSLRTTVLEQNRETEAAGEEVDRDRQVLEERETQSYQRMATLFEDTKPDEAARLMTGVYSPDEAAQIMLQLDDDRVRELIGAIHKSMPDEGPLYVKALQRAKGALPAGE